MDDRIEKIKILLEVALDAEARQDIKKLNVALDLMAMVLA